MKERNIYVVPWDTIPITVESNNSSRKYNSNKSNSQLLDSKAQFQLWSNLAFLVYEFLFS